VARANDIPCREQENSGQGEGKSEQGVVAYSADFGLVGAKTGFMRE